MTTQQQQLSLQMEANISTSMIGFKPLTKHVRSNLVLVMRFITRDMTRVRDAFDFNDNSLIAKWDVRRGEEEFTIDSQFETALAKNGFELLRGVNFDDEHEVDSNTVRRSIRIWVSGRDMVIISTELSDQGKHKYHEIRFCQVDVDLNERKTIQ